MHGVHTALVTPFAADGSVDLDAYARLAQRQLDAGVHGLVPCGTTGETPTLSEDEWAACIGVAVQVAGGSVPVTAGIGSNNTALAVQQAKQARELGVTAGLMAFPWYNKPNPEGHRRHLDAVLSAGLPIVLYHVPGRTGQRLSSKLLGELANRDGVIGVKEATGDLRYVSELLRFTDTAVLSGDDFTFLAALAVGGTGVISVVSNVDPEGTVAVYDAFRRGDLEDARRRNLALLDLVDYLFEDSNPVPCKAAMAAMGLCNERMRLPLAEGDPAGAVPVLERLGLL